MTSMKTRLWDALVWVLVIFPLVTGGIWLHRSGLKLELAELAIPVLLVSVLGLHLGRSGLSSASSVRLAERTWDFWKTVLKNRTCLTLSFSFFLVALLLGLSSIRRHWAFGSGAYDLGIFTNGLWNLSHGNGYFSSVRGGINLLTDHQSFIVWLIAPIFRVFPYEETLLIAQAVTLATGGVAAYFLARQYLGAKHWGTAAMPLLYWAYSPVRNANAFDYHPETMMLPLLLFAIVGIQSSKLSARLWGVLALILGLATKETAPALVSAVSLGWALGAGPENTRRFTKKFGIFLIPFSIALFAFELKWVPRLVGGEHFHLHEHLMQYGGTFWDLALAPFVRPSVFWGNLFGTSRLKFLFYTLAPLSFLPIFAWRNCLGSLPGYLLLFLTSGDHKVSIQYHYAIEPAVGLFWAMPSAILLAKNTRWEKLAQPGVVLFFALAFFGKSELYRIRRSAPDEHQVWLRQQFIPCLSQSSIAASSGFIPHVSARDWASEIGNILQTDGRPVSCVVIDYDLNNLSMAGAPWNGFLNRLAEQKYTSVYNCGSTTLYEHFQALGECMKCRPNCSGG